MTRKTTADDVAKSILRFIQGSSGGSHMGVRGSFRRTSAVKSGKGNNSTKHGKHGRGGRGGGRGGGGGGGSTAPVNPLRTAGSIIVAGLDGTQQELPIGPNGSVLGVFNGQVQWIDPVHMGSLPNYVVFVDGATTYDVTDENGSLLWA
jgi:hypothetical protein